MYIGILACQQVRITDGKRWRQESWASVERTAHALRVQLNQQVSFLVESWVPCTQQPRLTHSTVRDLGFVLVERVCRVRLCVESLVLRREDCQGEVAVLAGEWIHTDTLWRYEGDDPAT